MHRRSAAHSSNGIRGAPRPMRCWASPALLPEPAGHGALESLAHAAAIAGPGLRSRDIRPDRGGVDETWPPPAIASRCSRRALTAPPPNLNAHLGYAAALLTEGTISRWLAPIRIPLVHGAARRNIRPNYGKPVWDGRDMRGKTLLVGAEQGFGDVFQMLRYLPMLKARGARSCCSRSR